MALKTNVVKLCWEVVSVNKRTKHQIKTLVTAESREAAKLKIPETEEVVSVELMDGRGETTA